MDGREAVFLNHTLREEDGVFEVVAVPRHERDEHILAEGQFTEVRRRPVRHHVAAGDGVAHFDQRALVHAGVLVGTLVLGEVVDVHTRLAGRGFRVMDADHDAGGVDGIDTATTTSHHGDARVHSHRALHASADERHLGAERRDGLTLHVRAH